MAVTKPEVVHMTRPTTGMPAAIDLVFGVALAQERAGRNYILERSPSSPLWNSRATERLATATAAITNGADGDRKVLLRLPGPTADAPPQEVLIARNFPSNTFTVLHTDKNDKPAKNSQPVR